MGSSIRKLRKIIAATTRTWTRINEETRQEVKNPVVKVLEKGAIVGLANHSLLVRRDGTQIPIDDSGSPIKDGNGRVTGVVLVFHDITERKKTEQELDQYRKHLEEIVEEKTHQLKNSERLAAIGATAGMVGHDIRNPLQAIISDAFLVNSDLASIPDSKEKQNIKESIFSIEKNVDYINKIVQDLQDYARPLTLSFAETDLDKLCEEVLVKRAIPENINSSCVIEPEVKKINADPALLKRILTNLVNNAVQAMPNGGKLAIHACREADDTVITVEDTGFGISEEIKPKLFTPLFTTKSKGQGFGLAVVKRMTEALGGTIIFQSEVDKGTTFILRLPNKTVKSFLEPKI